MMDALNAVQEAGKNSKQKDVHADNLLKVAQECLELNEDYAQISS